MADTRISDLTEFSGTLAPDDWVHLVDKSDTSQNAGGSSFKIQAKNLIGRVLLSTITNTSANQFDFDSIPSGYNRLIIRGCIRSNDTNFSEEIRAFFNTDTITEDANYHTQRVVGTNNGSSFVEWPRATIGNIPAASAPTNSYANLEMTVEDYTGTYLKQAMSHVTAYVGDDVLSVGTYAITSSITAAITRIRIRAFNHPSDQLLGTLRLYGEM